MRQTTDPTVIRHFPRPSGSGSDRSGGAFARGAGCSGSRHEKAPPDTGGAVRDHGIMGGCRPNARGQCDALRRPERTRTGTGCSCGRGPSASSIRFRPFAIPPANTRTRVSRGRFADAVLLWVISALAKGSRRSDGDEPGSVPVGSGQAGVSPRRSADRDGRTPLPPSMGRAMGREVPVGNRGGPARFQEPNSEP